MKRIYLDYNATTPICSSAVSAMNACFAKGYLNPSSQHRSGQNARHALEDHRDRMAQLLGARIGSSPDQLIFTSGGTEANNMALLGLVQPQRGPILISSVEHPSVLGAGDELRRRGFSVVSIPANTDGIVSVDFIAEQCESNVPPQLVSVMLANNETGVLQPLDEIAALCAKHHIRLHTDATQMVGKLPVSFQDLNVSAMTFAAHKLHGPIGIGGLLVRHGVAIRPMIFGGSQQLEKRPGTESVALVAGMAAALDHCLQRQDQWISAISELRNHLQQRLLDAKLDANINGHLAPRLPNSLNVAFPGIDRQALLLALDLAGVECSTGSACASGSSQPSTVLSAMGLSDHLISSSLRISLGSENTKAEIDDAAERIIKCVNTLRQTKSLQKNTVSNSSRSENPL
ncbi:MAG: cysteine desulfurase family protein [Pirellulaceae bacterium]